MWPGGWRIFRCISERRGVCSGAIASKLAPTLDLCRPQKPCGSEPARDGGTSFNNNLCSG
ncbi:hypothetical protein EJA72_21530 [Pseudomonas sp. PB120]|nr:hypothetical protein [Pseudomonas sp. PB120]